MKAAFRKNWKHYLQEALGLAIFMISACFFSAMLFSQKSSWYHTIPSFDNKKYFDGYSHGKHGVIHILFSVHSAEWITN